MLELALLGIFAALLIVWAASSLVALLVAAPIALVVIVGQYMGLNWWQALIAGVVAWAIGFQLVDAFYRRDFSRKHEQMRLPGDLVGRQIEVEGRLVEILGSAGRKIIVRNPTELKGRRIDPHLVRSKIVP